MTTTNHDRRIEKLEAFMEQLTLGSYLAKAASSGESVLGREPSAGDTQLAGAVTGDVRMNKLENRVTKLEGFTQNLYDEIIGAPREPAGERDALSTLAKAQSAVKRKTTPEGLLARAQAVIDDPTEFGVIESYLQGGQIRKATEILERHEQRDAHADEDSAQERVEAQIDSYDQMATISELSENLTSVQEALNSILNRLSRLERPKSAPAQEPSVVAKGYGKRRKPTAYGDSVQGLAARADGVIDSPARVGYLNSLLQSGDPTQIKQARVAIEAAELAHESDVKKRDRRQL